MLVYLALAARRRHLSRNFINLGSSALRSVFALLSFISNVATKEHEIALLCVVFLFVAGFGFFHYGNDLSQIKPIVTGILNPSSTGMSPLFTVV